MTHLRFALRMLGRQPGFALTVVATLALAIGANAAVFSVVDAVLLRPLPYPNAERLGMLSSVVLRGGVPGDEGYSHTGAVFEAVRDEVPGVDVAAVSGLSAQVSLVAGAAAVSVRPQRVSAGYFEVLGVPPAYGRGFTQEEDSRGGPPAVVLSDRLWRNVLGGDPAIVGQTIRLKGEPHVVAGIMPAGFRTNVDADVWTPLRPSRVGEGEGTNYGVLLRLKDGVTWPEARASVAAAAAPAISLPPGRSDLSITHGITPLQEGLASVARRPLLLLWGAVALVLLVACTNLAGLLLARAGSRTREIGTRLAVGAPRAVVVRQLLVESLLLAVVGGVLGLGVGALALQAMGPALADVLPAWREVTLDARVVAMTMGVSVATAVLFGLVPALQTTRLDVQAALGDGGTRSVAGGASGWPRRLLVVGQVALGAVLLVGAGLLLRSFLHLQSRPPGFDSSGLVTASASLEDARYADHAAVQRLFDESVERLSQLPGVRQVAVSLGLPYERILNMGAEIVGDAVVDGFQLSTATYVTPGYFETLGLPVRGGRTFNRFDTATSAPVVVVNETFVRRYFDGREPVGRHVRIAGAEREIVGVSADVPQEAGFMEFAPLDALPGIYIPFAQFPGGGLRTFHAWFSPAWLVRTSAAGAASETQLRAAMREVDPELPLSAVRTIDTLRRGALSQQRLLTTLVGVLGFVALLLAALGIHGIIASGVAERRRELGIRLALGASVGQAVRRASLPGIVLAAIGLVLGTVAAWAGTGTLRGLIWGVPEHDPVTYAAVGAVLLLVAAVASLVPALDVRRLDPARLLRE